MNNLRVRLADPQEVRAHLVAAASAGQSITYSELLHQLGHEFTRPNARFVQGAGRGRPGRRERGEPELAVLVVRQSDRMPGQGWWVDGGASSHGYSGSWEGPQARRLVEKLQARAFDYWKHRS